MRTGLAALPTPGAVTVVGPTFSVAVIEYAVRPVLTCAGTAMEHWK
jgi:hypothetical protein